MKKQLLAAAAVLSAVICLGPASAAAQLPGGLKVPKIPKREKAQPVPTPAPAESAPAAPSGATQVSAPAAATPAASAQPQASAQPGGPTVLKHSVAVHART